MTLITTFVTLIKKKYLIQIKMMFFLQMTIGQMMLFEVKKNPPKDTEIYDLAVKIYLSSRDLLLKMADDPQKDFF